MKKFCLFSVLSIFLLSCNSELKEDAVFDPKNPETPAIAKRADTLMAEVVSVFLFRNYGVELYVQTKNNNNLLRVDNFDNLPENLVASYNIIRNSKDEVIYTAEFPYSASGEWENIYEHIFNDDGNLLLFMRKSTFQNGRQSVSEKSEYYYNAAHKLLKKTYEIKDDKDQEITDYSEISFLYRFPYEQYKTRSEWLKAHKID
ncbi:MAG: hypothetical protein LBR81_05185 [Prevotellaceae bacterium]|jgi:hypothetical protein|nr:hypothetical protein [Prevotellaceae bacterium]